MTQISNDKMNDDQFLTDDPNANLNDIDIAERKRASRRRFVKAVGIAAPAVMTLRGGQAMAQSSFTLSACLAEQSEMGQVAQNAMGDKLYFVVDVHSNGISVRPANADDPGAQTVTASCMASLI